MKEDEKIISHLEDGESEAGVGDKVGNHACEVRALLHRKLVRLLQLVPECVLQ